MSTPRIAFAVGPASGADPVQPVTRFSAATVKRNLGGGPEVTMTIPGRSPAALVIDGLATDLWVYDSGELSQRCRIMPVKQKWGTNGQDDANITAVGYKRLVEGRYIVSGPPTFTNVDQGSIMWQLVQHTQGQTNGSLGITAGTYTTGQLRTRTEYKIGMGIGQIMRDLGQVQNGAWWGVDAQRVFTARLWDDFPTRTEPIVWGMNAREMTRDPGKQFANVAGASGSATNTTPEWVAADDLSTDPRGRWEVFDSTHSSTTLQATVASHAAGALARAQHPPAVWNIDLEPADYFEGSSRYSEGDFVQIVVPASAINEIGAPVNVLAQITELVIKATEDGAVQVLLAAVEVGTL